MDSDISIVFWFVSGIMWTTEMTTWQYTSSLSVRIGKQFVTGG